MEDKKTRSWGWIIFWVVIFWPIGLFLLIQKLTTDKTALMSNKKQIFTILGWILVVIGVGGFFTELSDGPEMFGIVLALMFLTGGILTLRKVSEMKKTAEKYKRYINIIVNQKIRNIDNITSYAELPYDVVLNDLQKMVSIGYLKDAYIHEGNREIVLTQEEALASSGSVGTNQSAHTSKVVRCSGCGANNIIAEGSISECEYCGTPIN